MGEEGMRTRKRPCAACIVAATMTWIASSGAAAGGNLDCAEIPQVQTAVAAPEAPVLLRVVGEAAPPRAPAPLSRPEEAGLRPGDAFKECADCPDMVVVPAGRFTMGAPKHEPASSKSERPQRVVAFARPFAVGRFAVTFAEWDACLADRGCFGQRPSDQGWGRGRRPVINLTWHDADAYVRWLARRTGRPYRMLSEAEREYAARAGTTTPFWWGAQASTDRANYNGDLVYACGKKGENRGRTLPADSFAPNPFGLHQVHGNVSDWVEDCWNDSYDGAPADGSAWKDGHCHMRVMRGGAWSRTPKAMRSASRIAFGSDISMQYFGLRVARSIAP